MSLAGLNRNLSLHVAGNHQPQWNLGALKKDTRMNAIPKPLSAIWQNMMHRTHAWLCKELGAVPEWQVRNLRDHLACVQYQLAMTNSPVWHGPWKERKDGTGKYRSVKVRKTVEVWRTQKHTYGVTSPYRTSWYDTIPTPPWDVVKPAELPPNPHIDEDIPF